MTRQERRMGVEDPGRQNWPEIKGPIDNYGEAWGRVLEPLRENFTVDPEDSSSGTNDGEIDLFSGTSSDSSSGGPSDEAQQPTETESSDDVGENLTCWEEDDGDS